MCYVILRPFSWRAPCSIMIYPVRYYVVCGNLLRHILWSVGWEIEGGYSISHELLHEVLCGISVYLVSYTVVRLAIVRYILWTISLFWIGWKVPFRATVETFFVYRIRYILSGRNVISCVITTLYSVVWWCYIMLLICEQCRKRNILYVVPISYGRLWYIIRYPLFILCYIL